MAMFEMGADPANTNSSEADDKLLEKTAIPHHSRRFLGKQDDLEVVSTFTGACMCFLLTSILRLNVTGFFLAIHSRFSRVSCQRRFLGLMTWIIFLHNYCFVVAIPFEFGGMVPTRKLIRLGLFLWRLLQ
jgi:hypothetical protein